MQQYFDIRETKFANWAKVVSDDALREDASFKEQEDRRKAAADSDAQTATNSAALQSDTKMEVETSANDSVQDASVIVMEMQLIPVQIQPLKQQALSPTPPQFNDLEENFSRWCYNRAKRISKIEFYLSNIIYIYI